MTTLPECHRLIVIDDHRSLHDDFRKILAGHSSEPSAFERAEQALFDVGVSRPPVESYLVDSAFQGEALNRLKMCGDCRVIDQFSTPRQTRITDL